MNIGKIVGTVVCTRKDERLVGLKLLVVQTLTVEMKPTSSYTIAVDTVQAGEGDIIMMVSGSSARQTAQTDKKPVDAAVVGIIDTVSLTNHELERSR